MQKYHMEVQTTFLHFDNSMLQFGIKTMLKGVVDSLILSM